MGYEPEEPYVIQSGDKEGEVAELMMFTDYWWLQKELKKREKRYTGKREKDKLLKHLEWLLNYKGESRQPKMACPRCRKEPVKFFSVVYVGNDFSANPEYTCCQKEECMKNLRCMSFEPRPDFLPFKFSVMRKFSKGDQKRIGSLFRQVFQLPKPLSREEAFKFFKELP